ncbi:MAG: DUF58 domain-containing protein, partial [Myxococcota bacterium]|nr:DUF58 domain-containing protein [Myxococcota bacterium]
FGDSPHAIAWKASAKRQELLVRSWHADAHQDAQLLIDIGPGSRRGRLGERPIDRAVSRATAIIEHNPEWRIGVLAYDRRIYQAIEPGRGAAHRHGLIRHLMHLTQVVDEDLTEVSTEELILTVAQYLWLHRRNHDFWRAPTQNKVLPGEVFNHPAVRTVDTDLLFQVVSDELRRFRRDGQRLLLGKNRVAKNLFAARLRVFCALNSIRLPYRLTLDEHDSLAGLTQSLEQAIRQPNLDAVTILTPRWPQLSDTKFGALIRRCRRHGLKLLVEPTAPLDNDTHRRIRRHGLTINR